MQFGYSMRPVWGALLSSTIRRPFHVLTITLLSLLLPLSFLLLARLSSANFFSSSHTFPSSQQPSLLSLFFHPGKPSPIHAAVSVISASALLHCLTGWTPFRVDPPATVVTGGRSSLSLAWALLCTLQVSVGLGVEGSIASGIDSSLHLGARRSLASRAFFFLGLHETMAHWCWAIVRPVVDDTVYGAVGVDAIRRWPEKAAMAAAYGGVWWWRLRDEVESMVIVPQVKKELLMGLGMVDFAGWWLYYLTVTVGMVRVMKGTLWVASYLLSWRVRHKFGASHGEQDMV